MSKIRTKMMFRAALVVAMLGLSSLVSGCGDQASPPEAGSSSPVAAGAAVPSGLELGDPAAYQAEVEAWHGRRLENLKKEGGWLSLVGLYWLKEGKNTFGSAPDNDLVFPAKAAPHLGLLLRTGDTVTLKASPTAGISTEETIATELELAADTTGEPTILNVDTFSFYVVQREDRVGIRLKDKESPVRLGFEGIERFPVDPAYRIVARWEPYDPPHTVQTPNVLGQLSEEECPGAAVFEWQGQEIRLEPTRDGENLFLVFGDQTNGHETYGGGRFLEVAAPVDGFVVLDFNKAVDPPCVFTPYATCPLPRPENKIAVRLAAGEKMWGAPHEG
jgi:uncharacterized protein (DUF1684 family)